MQLVEQHVIKRTDSRYQAIDQAAFASKNLYNLANYHMRQSFIHQGKYLGYADVNGSYNILRKASPNGFPNGVEAVAVQPVRLAV